MRKTNREKSYISHFTKAPSLLSNRSAKKRQWKNISFWPGRIIIAGDDEVEETNIAFGSFNNWSIANGRRIPTVYKANEDESRPR